MKIHCTPYLVLLMAFLLPSACNREISPDLIILNGKVITVDKDFTIAEALALRGDRILAVGSDDEIRNMAGPESRVYDAAGRSVIPGIIDAHLHPMQAAISETLEDIPDIRSIAELLEWIASQARVRQAGKWIIHPKLFFTRLHELRPPTLSELDSVAPFNPVFLNGSYGGMINSSAMSKSGISRETRDQGFLRDGRTQELTGSLRASAFRRLDLPERKPLSRVEKMNALADMFNRYHQFGITSLCSGAGNYDSFELYRQMKRENMLTMRIYQNILFRMGSAKDPQDIANAVKKLEYVTGYGDEWVRIGALKLILDGGILTGTAYLREPWGERAAGFFGTDEESYRGILNYSYLQLSETVREAIRQNWKFTAHCTGGGSVDMLLDAYEEVNDSKSIRDNRCSVIHGNFYTDQAMKRMAELGVHADMQAAWFYKDADAMKNILGEGRIRTFHPYRSLLDAGVTVNGGSDHMVGWDADASINPYNPFLAMWTLVSRTTERGDVIIPEEAVSREEALRMYTINNACASFEESIKGSIEPGKLADIAVLSGDLMHCPTEHIRDLRSVLTIAGGKIVYSSGRIALLDP